MDYFDYSQHIRNQLGDTLNETIQDCMDFCRKINAIGSTIDFFYLGYHCEHHLGLRIYSPYFLQHTNWPLETQLNKMEIYCKNAEALSQQGKRVPEFCIGVIGERIGLLTEDLSRNGHTKIPLASGQSMIRLDGIDYYIDIDSAYREREIETHTYLSEEHAIVI